VRHVGQQRAEREDQRRVEPLGDADHLLGEQAPAQGGLRAEQEDDVAAGGAGAPRADGGPHDGATLIGGEADVRAHGGEVGELLRVDLGERLGLPGLDQVAHAVAGGVGGVVPAGEGGDDHGALQRGLRQPADMLHEPQRYRRCAPPPDTARRG
jgi:hypothetical protein